MYISLLKFNFMTLNMPRFFTDGNWIVAQPLGTEKLARPNHPQPGLLHCAQKEIHAQGGWVWLVILA